jgi:hypothetical protein
VPSRGHGAVFETVIRTRLAAPVERLVPHPRLPLVTGVDVTRPAVYVWDLDLRPVGSVGADAPVYRSHGKSCCLASLFR